MKSESDSRLPKRNFTLERDILVNHPLVYMVLWSSATVGFLFLSTLIWTPFVPKGDQLIPVLRACQLEHVWLISLAQIAAFNAIDGGSTWIKRQEVCAYRGYWLVVL